VPPQLIDHNGNLIANPNSSGKGGGSGTTFSGVSGGSLGFNGGDQCITSTWWSFDGVIFGSETHTLPC
jgi:hypothetical protein